MGVVAEKEWEGLAGRLRGRTTLVIGRTDAGKTTLVIYLIKRLMGRKERVCLVDSDIGQSSLGPPGTISMKVFRRVRDLEDFTPDRMQFVGTVNPSKVFRLMVNGTAGMVDAARTTGTETIIIDTTGLVGGEPGKALKLSKIKAIRPDDIVAIEREDEMEHILAAIGGLKGIRVHRLRASRFAAERSRTNRMRYRDELYREYFKDAREVRLKAGPPEFAFRGRAFDIKVSPLDSGTVVGLNRGDETLALGIYNGMAEDAVILQTPLKRLEGIKRIVASDIVLKFNPIGKACDTQRGMKD